MKIPGIICAVLPVFCQLYLLYVLQPPRYPRARVWLYGLLTALCVAGSALLSAVFGTVTARNIIPPVFYLLIFAAGFYVDAYRGWRFLFTFLCTLVLSGFCGGLTAMAGLILDAPWLAVFLDAAACTGLALVVRLFAAKPYGRAQETSREGWGLLTLAPALAGILMYLITYYPVPLVNRPGDYLMSGAYIVTMIVCLVIVVVELNRHTEAVVRAARQEEQTRLQLKLMEAQYASMQESQRQLHILRHDMLHHIRLSAGLLAEGRTKEAEDYLRRIGDLVTSVDMKRYCVSRTGNITLTWYAREAERAGIRFDCRADIPCERAERSVDLCAVLANALQNALEGCRRAEEPYMSVSAVPAGRALLITVENSFDGVLKLERGLPVSRKEEEGHGLGLREIKEKAEAYGGYFKLSAEGGVFRLEAALGNMFE